MLKTLFYIVLIYFAIRFIRKVFVVRKAVKGMKSRMEEQQNSDNFTKTYKEGEITIKKPGRKSKGNYKSGDYVDYEEIEEKE